ncbi:MAG: arginine--tRNA ligase [Legionella sp. 21-45-4]|nr:MAG: arginine--tRNA ligase [Legionella sp. 21-45-4]
MKVIVEQLLTQALLELQSKSLAPVDSDVAIKVERCKDPAHGDFSSNLAFLLAKPCRKSPLEIAGWLQAELAQDPCVERVDIAAPGFINFTLSKSARTGVISRVVELGEKFGSSEYGQKKRVLLEYVSANPTGPLHVGHGRSAALGASLANLLCVAGFDVTREYYVNDAGRQMNILAVSVWLRYLALGGEPVVFPVNGYKGDYVNDIAQSLYSEYAMQWAHPWADIVSALPLDENEGGDKEIYIDALIQRAIECLGKAGFERFHQHALQAVLADIKADLAAFGVEYDSWFSEQSLFESGATQKGIDALIAAGHTYEDNGALWFRSTAFGDEKDRVLVRANGQTTYFASDVAYHWNKYNRGFDAVINLFGADHHGYVPRLKAVVRALGHDDTALTILLVQFAILYRDGIRLQMSTRSGSFVTLRELRDEVGGDAARFFYVMRKPEQHMDFDLNLAKSESSDNPVYYIQYAYARICSVFRQLITRELGGEDVGLGLSHLHLLDLSHEMTLIELLERYPEMIEVAAVAHEPHQIAYYLRELACALHSYYNAVPLLCEDHALRSARLALLAAVRIVLGNGMRILGLSTPESM